MASRKLTRFNINKAHNLFLQTFSQKQSCGRATFSTSIENVDKRAFHIPERIQRSTTDILKALNSTVSRDKSGPQYMLMDDPFLTPSSNSNKRTYARAKESGRETATWIKNSNPDLFNYPIDDPAIMAFRPLEEITEDTEVTELVLQEMVHCARVKDAIAVYKLCEKRGIEVSDAVKQSLLELVCFYNEEDAPSDDWLVEHYFTKHVHPGRLMTNTWKSHSLAEDLFTSLHPSPAAYNAIIMGNSKYNNVEDAWQLFQSAIKENVPLTTATYNSVLQILYIKNSDHDECWQLIKDVLGMMAKRGVRPDLGTLNNVLQVLSRMIIAGYAQASTLSLQVLEEMRLQGVEPCLATYYFLLVLHSGPRGSKNGLLYNILEELEKHEGTITVKDTRDSFFFLYAMQVCKTSLKDIDAGRRLNCLFEQGDNYKLLDQHFKELGYYRDFLELTLDCVPFSEFMDQFHELFPHVYSIERDVLLRILTEVSVQGSFEYLPSMWTVINDLVWYKTDQVLDKLLTSMGHYNPDKDQISKLSPLPGTEVVSLSKQFQMIIQQLVTYIEEMQTEVTIMRCSQMMHVLNNVGGSVVGGNLLKLLLARQTTIIGEIFPEYIEAFLDIAIMEENPDSAILCAEYCKLHDSYAAKDMALKVSAMPDLDATHRAKLAIAFGVTAQPEK